jgi:Ribbon-helix-helix protein, copG family
MTATTVARRGRPALAVEDKRVNLSLRVRPDAAAYLRRMADAQGITVSELLRIAVTDWLADQHAKR